VNPREETNILVRVYFPNDYTGRDEPYTVDEEHKGVFDYSRGRATMYYLFSWGYEMMEGKSSSVVNVSTREMDENATNISCKNTNKKTFKLKNGTDVDAIATFASLMYKTDMMHNPNFKDAYNYIIDIKDAEAQSQKKTTKIPGREMLLPRWGYPRLVYHWDLTAFSLNDIKKADKGGDALYSWYDFYIFSDPYFSYIDEQKIIVDIFKNAKKIRILGNASARDVGDNMKLALNRAQTLAFYIEEALGINVFGDEDKYTVGVGDSNFGVDEACSSTENSKKGRFAYIEIVTDVTETKPLNEAEIIAAEQQFKTESDNYIKAKNEFKPTTLTAKYIGRYDEEMEFYNYLDTNVDLTYSNIKDKYNHHIPCFWSLTPEGLNARLTFLHQCTRQGPTIGASDMSVDTNNPTNLSFGRPPVCILRIGDFIQSRIYIESLSLDYKNGNGLSWDLNPEGIGPQPMTANVSINFKFMGGQDLSGAISRLQNAVTFNYYANTGVYDDRSDSNYYFINPADGKEKLTGRPNTGFDSTEYLFNPTISIKSGANAEKVIGSYKNGLDYNGYIRNTETQDFVDKAEEIKKNSIMPELTSTSKPQLSDVIIRPPGQQEQQVPTIQTNEVTVKSRDPEGSIREFEYDPKSDAPLLMKGWF
jgi:hypothetical protein